MALRSQWPYTKQNKRKHVSFIIKNCDGLEDNAHPNINIRYWLENNDVVGVASSTVPLRYSKWKHIIPNATLYVDKCSIPTVTYSNVPRSIADKENMDIRDMFDNVFSDCGE